jgi:hypothetical protein
MNKEAVEVAELSDRELKRRIRESESALDEFEKADSAEIARTRKGDETLARAERTLETLEEAQAERKRRDQRDWLEKLPLGRALRDGRRQPPPTAKWLEQARRFSAPELRGERLDPTRLTEDDAAELERIIKKKREIVNDERAEPLTEAETATWERLLGKAAGDEDLFGRKRRDAAAKGKLDELIDARKVAKLPRQPLLAEPGAVQLPRTLYAWLTSDAARETGAITLMDVGVLYGVLACFQNDDASLFPNARFEGDAPDRALILPGGTGFDLRTHGQTAGSPLDPSGSGHVRLRPALAALALNEWLEIEQSVAELRIKLGSRARKLNEGPGG